MLGLLIRVSEDELKRFQKNSTLFDEKLTDKYYKQEWYLDLNKAWEGIHYLLTGESFMESTGKPTILGRAFFSFQILDKGKALGFDSPHFLNAKQVKETSDELQNLTEEEVRRRLNPKEMMEKEIFPEVWEDPEAIDYIVDTFEELREFYVVAAELDQAVLTLLR
jgi:DNA primase large subunit